MFELRMEQVTKRFGQKTVLDGVNQTLTNGVYGMLGENGAGKTTLMRILCGLIEPDEGQITFGDIPIRKLGAQYRHVLGYLPQEFGYYPDYTAEKYLRYLAQLKAIPCRERENRMDSIWELTGLYDVRRRKLKTFSGGMLRRLGIGQALLNDPKILILDEPTSGLDPRERIRFRNLISKMGRERIVLLSTHIVQDVEFIADEIFLMGRGRVTAAGSAERMLQSMQGKVWECVVDEASCQWLSQQYPVSNLRHEGNRICLRVASGKKPIPDAQACEPNLEDVYLFWQTFSSVRQEDREENRT